MNTIGIDTLKDHTNLPDCNEANDLGREERRLMMLTFGPSGRLDYPTEKLRMSNGCEVESYVIPDADRRKVLDALYPFTDIPSLDDTLLDLHVNRTFKVRDYIVTREGDGNFIVSPYYAEAGGTVLDWVMPEKANGDGTILSIGTIRR